MHRILRPLFLGGALAFGMPIASHLHAAQRLPELLPADHALASYFRAETATIEAGCLANIHTAEDWRSRRAEFRRQLADMLGLWPMPARTDLHPVITGRIEAAGFRVEKLHFQSIPGLYVTANLYLPAHANGPVPAVLYVCGHALVKTNGISYGNKVGYHHHGAWFARHGYACLLIDTIQLGEIEGLHHGTHREGMWWWNSRGYTPAGIEAWNSIRALDYLGTRPEIDANRIGMTGRSGGGSYTWTTAALDDRVRVAAPVAGITDLQNHVVDGCVEGHCDCMYFVNTYRWDFALNAALIAPRPLLIVNTDTDPIFPLDGVQRLHAKTRRIYALENAATNLGLVIGPGGHADTQDLQVPVLRWFDRHLKGTNPPIEIAAAKQFAPPDLRVFTNLPPDQINTRIHEVFNSPHPDVVSRAQAVATLRQRSFAGWPAIPPNLDLKELRQVNRNGLALRVYGFKSQENVELQLFIVQSTRTRKPQRIDLEILDERTWPAFRDSLLEQFAPAMRDLLQELGVPTGETATLPNSASSTRDNAALHALSRTGTAHAWLAPRGVGPTAWSGDSRCQVQIRRRFMLLGQTLDGMRVWDVLRGLQALRATAATHDTPINLSAEGPMAVNALYAALVDGKVEQFQPRALPSSLRDGPDYLHALHVLDIPQAMNLLHNPRQPSAHR